ncbi:MAG: TlpA disulfide reductase family protein [Rhodocyclaceae bacterium]
MKQETALRVAIAAGVASLLTVGLLGYRLFNHASLEPESPPTGLASSLQQTPEAAQAAADAVLALTLPDLDGRPQPLAQWRGKILVLNYWASWCKPCVDEMPAFSRLNSHYSAWGVQFVGIGLDDVEKMRDFARATPVSYPLLAAAAGSTTPGLQVKGLPYTVVIRPDGRVETTRLGRMDEAALEQVLRRVIGK